ncbi:hypothetical protein ACHAPI_011476 [Fusarium lateritium]
MSYYDRSPTRSSRNNDTSFRGLDIEDIHAGKAIQWDFSDKIIFYRHMARYQITGRENVNRGLSELERDLGIQDRSTWYKQPILEKATASILYNLNQHCKGRVLTRSGRTWRWPQYSLLWLRSDWDGNIDAPDDGGDVRDDPARERASTPVGGRCRRPSRAEGYAFTEILASRAPSHISDSDASSQITASILSSGYVASMPTQISLDPSTVASSYTNSTLTSYKDDSEARLKRTEMQNRYVINIIRSIVPWKREMDDWRSGQDRTKVESLNVPEHVPILRSAASQYTADSHSEMQMFPDIPASVAAFNPRKGRLLSP